MIRWLRCLLGFHCSCSVEFRGAYWAVVCDRCGREVNITD